MDDMILAVMKSVNLWDVDCFIESLDRSGYIGRKVMFVEDIAADAQARLSWSGVELIPFTTRAEALSCHFQTSRYIPAAEYLANHRGEFRWVMFTDVWDVVFQSNPIDWLERHAASSRLIAAKEGWAIKNQGINDVWVKKLVGGEELVRLREEEVCCSGTIWGQADVMTDLLSRISEWVRSADGMQGLDQGMYNVLLRRSPFKNVLSIPDPSEGFISTCGPFLAPSDPAVWTIKPPVFDRETGLVMTPDGSRPFAIMHQYNRHHGVSDPNGDWRGIVERRYRS